MKICPKCGKENPDNATVCKYCGTKLTPSEADFEWELLLVAKNQFESDVVKDLLESNGIDVMIKRAPAGIMGTNMLANPLMGSSGAWSVYVMRMDIKKATEIIKAEGAENGTSQNVDEGSKKLSEE